jgi:hypothetical protein
MEYYDRYEESLVAALLATQSRYIKGEEPLIGSEDLNLAWDIIAKEFIIDAAKNINQYPEFTLALPGFFAMALSKMWDENWAEGVKYGYERLCGPQGFDYADEYIAQKILKIGLLSPQYKALVDQMHTFATCAMTKIRQEQIQPGTSDAFNVLNRSLRAVFRVSAALALFDLGYKFTKS